MPDQPVSDPVVAIRTSYQRGVDAVLTDATGNIIEEFSKDCYAPAAVTPFISECAERHSNMVLVVSPSDPWPPHLQRAVEEIGLPISWVSRPFERQAHDGARPFRRQRRQYGARLLARLYFGQHYRLLDDGYESGVEWEHHLAQQTLQAIEVYRNKAYEF